jgi:hypothetical protein
MSMLDVDWQMQQISAVQAEPDKAIASLSGTIEVALTLGFSEEAWQRLETYLADDGSGTELEREVQAALLAWLRAERRLGMVREAALRGDLDQRKEDDHNG